MVEKQTTQEWADLPVVLAIHRAGTLRGAAKLLGVSHSTVLRRLDVVERALGSRLFERLPSGRHELTPAGQDAVETAQHVDEVMGVMERRIQGRDLELAGSVHLTMPSALLPVFAPDLAKFNARYPQIELSIASGFMYADLAHREADVALRITPAPSPELVGRKLCNVMCGVYGTKTYLARHKKPDYIGWPTTMQNAFAKWVAENVPASRVHFRITQDWQMKEAVDAGLGVTIMPCALGDSQRTWRRIKLAPELTTPIWILSHKDLRATTRMRVFREFLADAVLAKRALLEVSAP